MNSKFRVYNTYMCVTYIPNLILLLARALSLHAARSERKGRALLGRLLAVVFHWALLKSYPKYRKEPTGTSRGTWE